MALILLRHTEPDVAKGICYGRTDLDLRAEAEADIEEALERVAEPPSSIVSSPAKRCLTLAKRAKARFDVEYTALDALWEMDFGSWEGRPWVEIPRTELDLWAEDFMDARPHGGESVRQLQARVLTALTMLARNGPTLVITHAGIQKVAAAAMGQPDAWSLSLPYGHWLQYPDG